MSRQQTLSRSRIRSDVPTDHVLPNLTFPTALPVLHVPVRLHPLDVASRRVNIDVHVHIHSRTWRPSFHINTATPSAANADAKDISTRPGYLSSVCPICPSPAIRLGLIERREGQLDLPGQEESPVARREASKGGASGWYFRRELHRTTIPCYTTSTCPNPFHAASARSSRVHHARPSVPAIPTAINHARASLRHAQP